MFRHSKCMPLLLLCLSVCLASPVTHAQGKYTSADGEVLMDPTRPYRAQQKNTAKRRARLTNFTLNYIMNSGGHSRAMVNGKKVTEGDFVAGAKVARITSDSVVLQLNGEQRTLRLGGVKGIRKN